MLALLVATLASLSLAQVRSVVYKGTEVVENEVLVKLKPGKQAVLSESFRQANAIDIAKPVGRGQYVRLHSTAKDVPSLIQLLRSRSDVESVQPNHVFRATDTTPNDTYFNTYLWGLKNTAGSYPGNGSSTAGADIKATKAWDFGVGSNLSTVCVIDTGVDYNHPDLAANMWSAPATYTVTIGGKTITVPAGSHGYNAITQVPDPMDDHSHGTHCAGTIGAVGNNSLGVTGVNWTASIMACKFLASNGSGSESDAADCIEFIRQTKATFGAAANVRVLSNSWGGTDDAQVLHDAIDSANAAGMLFVAAAGNSNSNNDVTPFYPANYTSPNVLSVAASDANDNKAGFSCYGKTTVDLAAPGVGILSTLPGGGYGWKSGTSMATPHVAGVAYYLLSLNPNLTTQQLKDTLMNTVDTLSQWSNLTVTGGRLNMYKAAASVGDFSLSASGNHAVQGSSSSIRISSTALYGFRGNLNYSVSGAPSGLDISFSSTQAVGSDLVLTVAPSYAVAPGSYTITVTAQSSSSATVQRTRTLDVTVVVDAGPNFSLGSPESSKTVGRKGTATYEVDVNGLYGFAGNVNLSVNGLPTDANASFDTSSVSAGGSAVLTVVTGGNTPAGTFNLTVHGVDPTTFVSHDLSLTLVVNRPTDFQLVAAPTSRTVVRGTATSFSLTVVAKLGFTGSANLVVEGGNSQVTGSLDTSSVAADGSATLTVNTAPDTTPGIVWFKITATSGSIVKATRVSVNVTLPPDFWLSATPATQTIRRGESTTYGVTVNPQRGFSDAVNLSVSGLPSGATATFEPATVTGSGSTQLTVATAPETPAGTYTLTISGANTSLVRTRTVRLVVREWPTFRLSVSPSYLGMAATGTRTTTAQVQLLNGFNSDIALSVDGGGPGVTATISGRTITVKTVGAAKGTYTFTLTGVGGGITQTATFTVKV